MLNTFLLSFLNFLKIDRYSMQANRVFTQKNVKFGRFKT